VILGTLKGSLVTLKRPLRALFEAKVSYYDTFAFIHAKYRVFIAKYSYFH